MCPTHGKAIASSRSEDVVEVQLIVVQVNLSHTISKFVRLPSQSNSNNASGGEDPGSGSDQCPNPLTIAQISPC